MSNLINSDKSESLIKFWANKGFDIHQDVTGEYYYIDKKIKAFSVNYPDLEYCLKELAHYNL